MKQKPLRDHKGNELKLVLLQVMERGEQGPTLCRVRYDHEVIDVGNASEIQREFLMVYTPVDSVLGMGDLKGTPEELLEYRDLLLKAREEIKATKNVLATAERHALEQDAELREKTNALRDLQRERDPNRLEATVAARVESVTEQWRGQETAYRAEIATLKSRVAELEASKRKLREALDRAKEGRK